ncbi:hypothetical protein CSU57_05880 [Salmonella enterica subsp. enterica serovar Infantis]|nr:hypothetical protein [Salmonella enterica subsp. enterica serovar Infantis]EDX8060396.1 hypothetical protein [Salmonella enterica subsp. enterica serovar Java]EEM2536265.1 hypothetical protein [Salmonella enterica subsp. enterica serovar Morehead]HCD7425126.1 hypothetical protein [Citrobacter werkmanii]EBX5084959.1 hypothetical protein [Salmonella enterica subsp. enterica serovar Infantis]
MKQSDFRRKYVFNLEQVSERVSVDMVPLCTVVHRLSPAESRALILTVKGKKLREQARECYRSARTLSAQKRSAYEKMEIQSDIEFIHYLYWLRERMQIRLPEEKTE